MGVKMTSKARRTLVGVSAALMIAAPAAQAMPVDSAQNGRPAHIAAATTPHGVEYGDLRGQLGTSRLAGTTAPRPASEPAPASSGFDWTSGGIGVLVAAALALATWTALGTRRTARA
jgi:hypothetical protein